MITLKLVYYIIQKKDMNTNKFKDKRMNIMVNKIGLSEKKATWCLEKDKKYYIWIANQLKEFNFSFSNRERLIQF